jgi:hypothetical protein
MQENPDGRVIGAQIKYDTETQTEALPKGLIDIAAGDRIGAGSANELGRLSPAGNF